MYMKRPWSLFAPLGAIQPLWCGAHHFHLPIKRWQAVKTRRSTDMATTAALRKVLVVVGTTGAGKTKLSIDLAKAVGGEIINSDAMQMYRGLDIATAKITEQEKEGVPHHLFDVVEPSSRVDVLAFKKLALSTIEDVLARGKVPIVVGGTMYYTQSILWKSQLLDDVATTTTSESDDASSVHLDALSPEELYAKLREVDPVMAARLHVNNVRKVQRSLQVFLQTGTPHSEHLARQEREQLQLETYFDACAFWVHCNKPTLAERLAKRVDTMIRSGLEDEIRSLRAIVKANPPRLHADTGDDDGSGARSSTEEAENSVGILQAIGYKEFQPYFDALEAQDAATAGTDALESEATAAHLQRVFDECVEQLNVATRQYARRQLSWIRNRFVTRNIPVYQVDSSDVGQWDALVATPATRIAQAFLSGDAIPAPYTSVQQAQPEAKELSLAEKHAEHICAICGDRKFTGTKQWAAHLASKGHKFHVKRVAIEATGERSHRDLMRAKHARERASDAAPADKRHKASDSEASSLPPFGGDAESAAPASSPTTPASVENE